MSSEGFMLPYFKKTWIFGTWISFVLEMGCGPVSLKPTEDPYIQARSDPRVLYFHAVQLKFEKYLNQSQTPHFYSSFSNVQEIWKISKIIFPFPDERAQPSNPTLVFSTLDSSRKWGWPMSYEQTHDVEVSFDLTAKKWMIQFNGRELGDSLKEINRQFPGAKGIGITLRYQDEMTRRMSFIIIKLIFDQI